MITLRDVAEADLPTLYLHQADPLAAAMAGFTPRALDAFYTHWRTRVLADPGSRKQAVLVDGALAGNVVAFDREGLRLIGYWYGREFWGRGIASAALALFLELETPRPLYAYVIPSNVASMRVLTKNGFVKGAQRTAGDGVEEVLFTLRGGAA